MTRYMLAAILLGAMAPTAHAELRVVATLPDLAALAADIGGDLVTVHALVRPTEDPHYVDAKPSLLLPLARADVLVLNGLGLELGWLPPLLTNARNGEIQVGGRGYFDASTTVHHKLNVAKGRVDRAQGDIHPGGNPHFTHDPRRAAEIARALGERFATLDPDNADRYRVSARRVADELVELAATQRARFSALTAAQRRVVVYHDSWVYLTDWLGLEQVATVEERPGIKPSPAHVARVLGTMRTTGAHIIIQEEYYPRGTSKTLSRLAEGQLTVLRAGTHFEDGERYATHVKEVADLLYQTLTK